MPTLIDALIVEIGLDPRGFTAGQKVIVDDLRRTEAEATRTGKNLEAGGKRAGAFFKEMRGQATALFAVLTAGRGLANFTKETLTQDAATGRLAKSIGLATSELGEWQRVAVRTGGTAQGITGSLSGLVDQFQQIQLTGTSASAPYLQALGLKREDLDDASGAILKISDAMAKMDPRRARAFGQALGFDQETTNLLMRGRPAVEAMLEAEKRRGGVSDESAKKTEALNAQLADLKANSDQAGRELLISAAPALTKLLELLNSILSASPGVTKALWGVTAAVSALSTIKIGAGLLGVLGRIFPAAGAAAGAAEGAAAAGGGVAAKAAAGGGVRAALAAGAARAAPWLLGAARTGGPIGAFLTTLLTPTVANAGEDEAVARMHAEWDKDPRNPKNKSGTPQAAAAATSGNLARDTKDFIQGREGFASKAYWDMNAYRVGHGSDTITDPATGRVSRVTKDTRGVTKEMAGADLERRIAREFLPNAQRASGSGWDKLSHASQVALVSMAYNYGSIDRDVLKGVKGAAQRGDDVGLAAAIRARQGDNNGINRDRRNFEANSILQGLRTGARAGQTGAAGQGGAAGGPSTTNIGTINIQTQATDAKGIARDIGPAVRSQGVATQAQSGLR